MSDYAIPFFLLITFIVSCFSKKDTLEDFIVGIKDGISILLIVVPYLIAMVFATTLFIKSNILMDFMNSLGLDTNTNVLLHGLMRPISSSSSLSMLMTNFSQYGVDSSSSIKMSILQGSTDTTIYIATLYFGSIGITKYRYAIIAGLMVDMLAFIFVHFVLFSVL